MGCIKGTNKALPKEAQNWNDMPPAEQKCKRATTLSLIALSIIIAVGIAVAIYFCCTTSSYVMRGGKKVLESNAAFSALPSVFGGAGIIAAVVGAICCHIFWGKNFDNRIPDQLRIELKGANTLETVYQRYHRKIRPLVVREILTVEEAKELQEILEGYHQLQDVKNSYDRLGTTDKQDVDKNLSHYPQYSSMKTDLASLRERWSNLHAKKFPTSD